MNKFENVFIKKKLIKTLSKIKYLLFLEKHASIFSKVFLQFFVTFPQKFNPIECSKNADLESARLDPVHLGELQASNAKPR